VPPERDDAALEILISNVRGDIFDDEAHNSNEADVEFAGMEREEEVMALEAIFDKDFALVSKYRYIIKSNLHVLLPPAYPLLLPAKFFFYQPSLAPSLLRKINAAINKEAMQNVGAPSIFIVNTFLEEHLDDFKQRFSEQQQQKEMKALKRREDTEKGLVDVEDIQERMDAGEKIGKRARQKLKAAQKSFARVSNYSDAKATDSTTKVVKSEEEQLREFKSFQAKLGDRRAAEHMEAAHLKEADRLARMVMLKALNAGKSNEEARMLHDNERNRVLREYGYEEEIEEKSQKDDAVEEIEEIEEVVDVAEEAVVEKVKEVSAWFVAVLARSLPPRNQFTVPSFFLSRL